MRSGRKKWHIRKMKRWGIKFLRNKFVLALLLNLIYISFIHNINLFYIVRSKIETERLGDEIEMMKEKNIQVQQDLVEISNNKKTLEKYAREEFYMKRDKEDVYVIKSKMNLEK
jgi:cell division protein FtsB